MAAMTEASSQAFLHTQIANTSRYAVLICSIGSFKIEIRSGKLDCDLFSMSLPSDKPRLIRAELRLTDGIQSDGIGNWLKHEAFLLI